jgi:hypothetical protein
MAFKKRRIAGWFVVGLWGSILAAILWFIGGKIMIFSF